jgi:hypothetical protein
VVCWVQPELLGTYFSEIVISHWYTTHFHTIFGQSVHAKQYLCLFLFFSARPPQQLKMQTYFQYLLYIWMKTTTQWTKMQVPPPSPSLPRKIRFVELLLYLQSCKMVQVLTDVKDHLKKLYLYQLCSVLSLSHTWQLNYQCKSKCSLTYISRHSSQSSAVGSSFGSSLITVPFQDFSCWYPIRVNIHTTVYAGD